ncbi:MAG TPA: HNH endonuclease signature motif containing protein, partial [Nocardioidaceae bacterium]|nr:HNH endonuclease signature motif containing protein [Nocardioidaceae bacterium]
PRSIEQRRVDLMVDRLLGRATSGQPADSGADSADAHSGPSSRPPAPVVAVTVPVQSLLGMDDTPGEVSGSGAPVPASLAREVLAQPGTLVYRLLTDPAGTLLDVSQLGRFRTAKLGFAVDARDRTCVFPTCHRAAVLCDADHTIPHPDGPTSYANLGCLCRRHHRLKTLGLAKLKQVEPGEFEWTMPTGTIHSVHAEPQPVGAWPHEPERPPPPTPDPDATTTAVLLDA